MQNDPTGKKQDRHRKPRSLSFSVPRIVFLPYGTVEPEDNDSMDDAGPSLAHLFPVIRCSKAPSTAEFSRLEALGLARANFHKYFHFHCDWDFPQLDEELHSLFPQLFAYLDSQPKAINHRYDSSKQDPCYKYLPPYHLCVKSRSEVAIASGADFPTGEIIYKKVKAGKRPSHDDSEILFITHNRIPNSVLEQWKYPMIKATGKRKAAYLSDSDTNQKFASRLAGSDDEFDAPVSPSKHRPKRLQVMRFTDSSDDMLTTPAMTPIMIDLSGPDTEMGESAGTSAPAELPPPTAPSTPVMSPARALQNNSFVIDDTITDPWKVNRTFHF
ncbi:hypothetical protein M404DRAFT_620851 [Pisolithus tinctorius Marx 270]|uniref:Uncharacterized protein n=1 Tax=Pisolithus tinctorius Marx 270 TaxID=870435 RepID=A0A0C3P777_PISTI|nr:hypothetical protein M404DRAFT_620851 [Pisolithus tinctorius Marx 270]